MASQTPGLGVGSVAGAEQEPRRFEVRVTADSHFAWLRTRMAAERTLMAWARTAIALVGFGFTIVQFFDRFSHMQGVAPALRPQAPRYFGLALIGTGTLAIAVALFQYRALLDYLWSKDYRVIAGVGDAPGTTPITSVAVLLIVLGLFAFGAVMLRMP